MKKTIHSKEVNKLCELLHAARQDAGYTQQQLATLLGKPQSFVAKYELGERRIDLIEFLDITKSLRTDPIIIIKALMKK